MSKRNWIVAASFGLIVFCVALWYSWDKFSTYQQNQADERAAAAEYQADTAQHSPYSCRPVMDKSGIFDWLTCLANNVSADGGVKQAEYDLKAQQDMSAWALGMLIATVWLTVITLFGVVFVWRTLLATQDMARETREIGEAQARAYLSVKEVELEIGHEDFGASPLTLTIGFTIRNLGQSYARDIRAEVNWERRKSEKANVREIPANDSEPVKIRVRTSTKELSIQEGKTSNVKLRAEVRLKYRTVFSHPQSQAKEIYRYYEFYVDLVEGFKGQPAAFVTESFEIPSIGNFTSATFDSFGNIISGEMADDK